MEVGKVIGLSRTIFFLTTTFPTFAYRNHQHAPKLPERHSILLCPEICMVEKTGATLGVRGLPRPRSV